MHPRFDDGDQTALDTPGEPLQDETTQDSCAAVIGEAGASLLSRAVDDRAVRADITVDDLLTLIVGIALATENCTDPKAQADRAFRIAVASTPPEPDRSPSSRRRRTVRSVP